MARGKFRYDRFRFILCFCLGGIAGAFLQSALTTQQTVGGEVSACPTCLPCKTGHCSSCPSSSCPPAALAHVPERLLSSALETRPQAESSTSACSLGLEAGDHLVHYGESQSYWVTSQVARKFIVVRTRTSVPFYMVTADPALDQMVSSNLWSGMWEEHVTLVAERAAAAAVQEADGCFVLDAGSNIGWFSMVMASYGCQVEAFDVQERVLKLMNHSAHLNGFQDRITLHQGAISRTPVSVEASNSFNWGGTFVQHSTSSDVTSRPVPTLILDDFVPPGRQVALLKLDVEGFEAVVLDTLRRALNAKQVMNIVMEFQPKKNGRKGIDAVRAAFELGHFAAANLLDDQEAGRVEKQFMSAAAAEAWLAGQREHVDLWFSQSANLGPHWTL